MRVRAVADPASFLAAASRLLLADEARHNLILGLAGTLRRHPGTYPDFRLWLVERDDEALLAALQTPPHNVVLSRPSDASAVAALAEALARERVSLPGVTAAVPEADEFAHLWSSLDKVAARRRMEQRIYRLTRVRPVTDVPGRRRLATLEHRALLVDWLSAFIDEVIPPDAAGRDAARVVDARLETGAGGYAIWEDADGRPVSVAGWGGETPNGVRIGPVYTPPAHRRHGFGSAVTAAASADRLAAGRRFCFLYTDLANPTSNRIYTEVGYEPVCDSVDYAFESL